MSSCNIRKHMHMHYRSTIVTITNINQNYETMQIKLKTYEIKVQ